MTDEQTAEAAIDAAKKAEEARDAAEKVADIACGVGPVATGQWDPYTQVACAPHDISFAAVSAAKLSTSQIVKQDFATQWAFVKNTTVVAAKGLYAVVMLVPYNILGAGVGFWRYFWLGEKGNNDANRSSK